MHAPPHSVPPALQQATRDPRLCPRLPDTHGQVQGSLLGGSLLLSSGSWHISFYCALRESISQSCVSSGGSVVGLMATSSKRAYAIPRPAAPRALAPAAGHCWHVPPRERLRHSSGSVSWVLWVLVCTRFVWAFRASLAGMGFDSKCDFAPLTILLGLLLCPWHGVSFFVGI